MSRIKLPKIDNLEIEFDDGKVITLQPVTTRLLNEIDKLGKAAQKISDNQGDSAEGLALLDKQLAMYFNEPVAFFEAMPFNHKSFIMTEIQEFLESNMSKTLKKNS